MLSDTGQLTVALFARARPPDPQEGGRGEARDRGQREASGHPQGHGGGRTKQAGLFLSSPHTHPHTHTLIIILVLEFLIWFFFIVSIFLMKYSVYSLKQYFKKFFGHVFLYL